jgi:hypothetical protein
MRMIRRMRTTSCGASHAERNKRRHLRYNAAHAGLALQREPCARRLSNDINENS